MEISRRDLSNYGAEHRFALKNNQITNGVAESFALTWLLKDVAHFTVILKTVIR